jgi:hypothetical protein
MYRKLFRGKFTDPRKPRRADFVEQRHFINTPLQIDAYRTSAPYGDNEDDALRLGVEFCLVQWYEQAVREGHQPENLG